MSRSVCPEGCLSEGVSVQGRCLPEGDVCLGGFCRGGTPPGPRGRHTLPHCILGYTPLCPLHDGIHTPSVDGQTPVKILPCLKLHLRGVKIFLRRSFFTIF